MCLGQTHGRHAETLLSLPARGVPTGSTMARQTSMTHTHTHEHDQHNSLECPIFAGKIARRSHRFEQYQL